MKNFKLKNTFLILLLAILTLGAICINSPTLKASADSTQPVTVGIFSPNEYPEYFKTQNAEYAVEDENHLVFTTKGSNDDKYSVVVYHKNPDSAKYNTYDVHADILEGDRGQILLWSYGEKDYLIYRTGQYMNLYALDLSTGVSSLTIDALSTTVPSATNFCRNDNYFVFAQTGTVFVYTASVVDNKVTFTQVHGYTFSNFTGIPLVSISEDNTLYVYKDGVLYSGNVNSGTLSSISFSANLTSLYATNDRLYFIEFLGTNNYNVGYFDVNNGLNKHVKISSVNLSTAKLGEIVTPKSISIFNNELLIVDTTENSTIQKFDAETFEFTGWAMATTQPTDTRIDNSTKHIAIFDNKIATLSNTKIKITDSKTGDIIKVINYDTTDFTAKMLALGKDTVAIASGDEIRFYSLTDTDLTPIKITSKKELQSCDYSAGRYYFASITDGGTIYVYNETDFSSCADIKEFKGKISDGAKIAVDVDGNINIYLNNDIYCKKASETAVASYQFNYPCNGIETDLDGNVYVLTSNNKLVKLNTDGTDNHKELSFVLHDNLKEEYTGITNGALATAFAMNFDDKNVYFIINGQSIILSSDKFDNRSITNVLVDDVKDKLSGTVGNKTVQKVTILGANLFTVKIDDNSSLFKYVERTIANNTEYLIIGEPYEGAGYTLLLDENNLYLIKNENLSNKVDAVTTSTVNTMFVSSDVNLYYYPVLSLDNAYCVYVDNEVLRLHVGQHLTVEGELTLNGKKFYYVSTTLDGTIRKGYLPETFLKTSLDYVDTTSEITYVNVSKDTLLYKTDFSGVIYTFSEDTKVRYIAKTQTHTLVEYYDGQNTYLGYVFNSAIINKPDYSVRNAVLIMVLSLAICATSLYLIHKRKVYIDAT